MIDPTLNKRQQSKLRTADKIKTAARTVFHREGYAAATMRSIAAEAGMSTGSIYANYKDKDELYMDLYGHPPVTPEVGREALLVLRAIDREGGLCTPETCERNLRLQNAYPNMKD